ncbi:MAG: A24 family peptidase, partial [Chloroflexota bacterium]
LLNKIIYPAAGIALIIDGFLPHSPGIVSGLIGGGIGFTLLLIPALISPRGMGFGDVKMAALIGLVTGFPLVFVALLVGIILGGLTAILLLLFRIKGRKETIPFGPFLSLATLATLLWGNQILSWYLGRF